MQLSGNFKWLSAFSGDKYGVEQVIIDNNVKKGNEYQCISSLNILEGMGFYTYYEIRVDMI